MAVCYYVTSHGLGHAIRVTQIVNALPPELPVIIRTLVPENIFREEIHREFRYLPAEIDCGCVQKDSISILPRQSLDRYRVISDRNRAGLRDEIAFLRREGVTCVAVDVPPFPLYAAREAGIPGIAITNFTWYETYRGYIETDEDRALVDRVAEEYRCATRALSTPVDTPGVKEVFGDVEPIPLVARRGRSIRERLEAKVGSGHHLALMYFGVWGLELDWNALAALRDWTFIMYDEPPVGVGNVVRLDRSDWNMADVAASVDAVVSKPGYGTVSECIANDVPLVYVPRTQFPECEGLIAGMEPWGGGFALTPEQFARADWSEALSSAMEKPRNVNVYDLSGARAAASVIGRYAGIRKYDAT